MPDLNLKGEDEQQFDSPKPSEGQAKRKLWLGILIGIVVLAVAAFGVIKLGIFQSERHDAPRTESTLISRPETLTQAAAPIDSVPKDTSKAVALLTAAGAQPESLAAHAPDSSLMSAPAGKYTIQLSAWQSNRKAQEEIAGLRASGLDTYLVKSEPDSAGKVWNRVRFGHFESLREAKSAAEQLPDSLKIHYTLEKEQ